VSGTAARATAGDGPAGGLDRDGHPGDEHGGGSDLREAARGGKSAAAFRTISEVAHELDVAQHVLRFWESKFPQVKPLKRGGGRRYYRPEDVELLRRIRGLLYEEGYTIKGVQKLLRTRRQPPAPGEIANALDEHEREVVSDAERLRALRDELAGLRDRLRAAAR
jgi:DNA-binding transcriptional MerR regulator